VANTEISKNAKVAAISFPLGAIMLHVLNQFDASLLPLRILAIATLVFGVWAFSDEMGLRKPLNRAAFVSFVIAMLALLVRDLGVRARVVCCVLASREGFKSGWSRWGICRCVALSAAGCRSSVDRAWCGAGVWATAGCTAR